MIPSCTLVTPLRNERDNIERLWAAIQCQTVLPGEWFIADNGSTDGTYEWLVERAAGSPFPVVVLSLPGQTIAAMMNAAIRAARHEIVACCHGGTTIPADWLENLLRPMLEDPAVDVAAGVWQACGETEFERWVAGFIPVDVDHLDVRTYLPASRSVAFKRSAWAAVGGFPEWLPKFGEDTLFDIRLRVAGFNFAIARDARVGWRPKSSARSLLRQGRLYSEADACMGLLALTPRLFLRPWVFPAVAALSGALLNSCLAGAAMLLGAAVADYMRHPRQGLRAYLLWRWLSPMAAQAGFLRGSFYRLSGLVRIPAGDRHAVQVYRSWRRGKG